MDTNEPAISGISGAVLSAETFIFEPVEPVFHAFIFNSSQGEVLRIGHDGRIFWKGREVESDDEFRKAMLDVRDCLASRYVHNGF